MQLQQLAALLQRAVHLLRQRGHIDLATAVDDLRLACAQPQRRAHAVHRHVAAADDQHALTGKVRRVVAADGAEQIDGGVDVPAVLALDADLLVRLRTDGDVHGIVLAAQLVDGDRVADLRVVAHLHARGEHAVDVLLQALAREAVVRDAIAQHAAQLRAQLEHGALMAHELQIVRRAQTAGAAADDGDRLARGRAADGRGHDARVVHRVALDAADVDGVVEHVAAAARLAGMLADERAGGRERFVLADEADGVRTASVAHKRNVARNIDARRAQRHAGHRLVDVIGAVAGRHMRNVLVVEALEAAQHHRRGLPADGAVRGILDVARQTLDVRKRLHRAAALKHVGQIGFQLPQPDAAGHALAAGLCVAKAEEIQRQIDRTKPGRAGDNATLEILVQPLDRCQRLVFDGDSESAHTMSSRWWKCSRLVKPCRAPDCPLNLLFPLYSILSVRQYK